MIKLLGLKNVERIKISFWVLNLENVFDLCQKKLRLFKGRSSKGIRGIDLSENDNVMSLSIVDNIKMDQSIIKKNGVKKKN